MGESKGARPPEECFLRSERTRFVVTHSVALGQAFLVSYLAALLMRKHGGLFLPQLPCLRTGPRGIRLRLVAPGCHLVDDALGAEDLLLGIFKLGPVQPELLPQACRLLLCAVLALRLHLQATKVLERTALGRVRTCRLSFEAVVGDCEARVDLSELVVPAE